jgi:hypothetical protein
MPSRTVEVGGEQPWFARCSHVEVAGYLCKCGVSTRLTQPVFQQAHRKDVILGLNYD